MPKKRIKKFWHSTSLLKNPNQKIINHSNKNKPSTPTKKSNPKTPNQNNTNPKTLKPNMHWPNQSNPPNTKAVSEEKPNLV